jgi:hypothetical protein
MSTIGFSGCPTCPGGNIAAPASTLFKLCGFPY